MTDRRAEVLLLGHFPRRTAATVHDSRDGLVRYSRHRVRALSVLDRMPGGLDLNRFDAVAVHYSLAALHPEILAPAMFESLADYEGAKLVFLQDEYQNVEARVRALRSIGADVLFTCVPEPEVGKVYPSAVLPRLRTVSVLTGYVSDYLVRHTPPALPERRFDVVYRGRRLPFWLGALAQEKAWISERFSQDAQRFGLTVDLSCEDSDRLYGEAWLSFLGSGRAVLGTESGASVFDHDGAVRRGVEAMLADNPDCGFAAVAERLLAGLEGRVRINQISPRMFEAAACRTLMVNYVGDYSGILQPWRHYVPLEKDHGNVEEVVAVLRDEARVEKITAAAFTEVVLDPRLHYGTLAARFDSALDELLDERQKPPRSAYGDVEFRRIARMAAYRVQRHEGLVGLKEWVATVAVPACVPQRYREGTLSRLQRLYRALAGGTSTDSPRGFGR